MDPASRYIHGPFSSCQRECPVSNGLRAPEHRHDQHLSCFFCLIFLLQTKKLHFCPLKLYPASPGSPVASPSGCNVKKHWYRNDQNNMTICIYICVCYLFIFSHIYIYICMYVCMYVCMHVCLSVCLSVCMHA